MPKAKTPTTRKGLPKPKGPKPWWGALCRRTYYMAVTRSSETRAERKARLARRAMRQNRPRRARLKSNREMQVANAARAARARLRTSKRPRDEFGRFA